MNIFMDQGRPIGTIKALHGVNNGPIGYGSLIDVSHHYQAAGFPLVRLHDPNFPHPREIDIHTIFPDFSRDPEDPASYDFSRSDYYIRTILATGARIVWRLGESIEHTPEKYYVYPPADAAQWARICIGIIRHYNYGWANGFHYDIRYWEIWNEPEGGGGLMWTGTAEQFRHLYRVAAPLIKAFDPALKIGGYGAALPMGEAEFFENFLDMCEREQIPLDFFSWHSYNDDPAVAREISEYVRAGLDRYGFTKAESHYNEWNFFDGDWTTLFLPGNERDRRELFEKAKGTQGASFAAAMLLTLQDCPVDEANYYDGQPFSVWCGLFDYYGVPTKTYHAFRLFNDLCHHSQRLHVHLDDEGVYACAGRNTAGEMAVLLSRYRGPSGIGKVVIRNALPGEWLVEQYRIDEDCDGQLISELEVGDSQPFQLPLPAFSVVYLKFRRKR